MWIIFSLAAGKRDVDKYHAELMDKPEMRAVKLFLKKAM
ncbi:hypothetical protein KIS1582_2690 [Cytobacillus firmus]|uniref:Uncharacterized protein n=1 Tax=Cytobacillus firmus TaxID=1399 RepID=A0A800MW13_CYTFI|nr:hypothetical protein KIS1582_2690 [Cytobacillus firmus]